MVEADIVRGSRVPEGHIHIQLLEHYNGGRAGLEE